MNDAYAAVARAGASAGVMVVKAGPKKTRKLTPFKVLCPLFEGDVLVDGLYRGWVGKDGGEEKTSCVMFISTL